MKRIAVIVAAALVAAPGGATAASTSDADRVRAVILRQAALFKQARWRALWELYTPGYRARCGYERWLRGQRASLRNIGTNWAVRDIRVAVSGRRANARYSIAQGDRIVYRTRRPDVYMKIAGRWRDAYDSETTC